MEGALVLDWDWSTVNENTDTWVPQQLDPDMMRYIKSRSAAGDQWTALMADVARKMHSKGVTPEDIDHALCAIPVFKEILQAIQLAYEHGLDVHIVSDANQVYINTIAQHHGIDRFITSVVTNTAAYNTKGLLVIGPHQPSSSPHGCGLCPVNLCKGQALDRLGLSYDDTSALRDEHSSSEKADIEVLQMPGALGKRGRRRSGGGAAASAGASVGSSGAGSGLASLVARCMGPTASSADLGPSVAGGTKLKKRVLYLGDGRGDLCACLRLGP
jgi:2,3-diketo-5-methylthio-1-phosphopentane phosphatase